MTKKLSIAGLVVAAAASTATLFLGNSSAKAACLTTTGTLGSGGYNPCVTFDNTNTTITDFQAFSGSSSSLNPIVNYARIGFIFSGFTTNTGLSAKNITLAGPGIVSTISFSDVTISGNNFLATNIVALDSPLAAFDFADSKLSFQWDGGYANPGATVSLNIAYCSNINCTNNPVSDQFVQNTVANAFTYPATGTPSPLPLIGAGTAFGFSRSIRRRISQSA